MGIFDLPKKKDTQQNSAGREMLQKIQVIPGFTMPKAFAEHWPEIEKTKLTYISITATLRDDLSLQHSKFGHYPCMPLGFDYPADEKGNFMYPLAQINFSETPALAGYPVSGYLQFYISGFDDIYGLDFDNAQSQKNFRVLYFEENAVEKHKVDFSFLDDVMKSDLTPVHKPHALDFEIKNEYVGPGDVRSEEKGSISLSKIAQQYPAIEDELEDAVFETFPANGHKIGGYAYFTQADPRSNKPEFSDYILLLQIDSDEQIMWGDVGVCNFFIHPDDLLKKDFSRVMYNWDCG